MFSYVTHYSPTISMGLFFIYLKKYKKVLLLIKKTYNTSVPKITVLFINN